MIEAIFLIIIGIITIICGILIGNQMADNNQQLSDYYESKRIK